MTSAFLVARKWNCCGSQSRRTRVMTSKPPTIAFVFDYKSPWLALELSKEEDSHDTDDHGIPDIVCTLERLGYRVLQVDDIKNLVERLANEEYREWDLVLNIAEGLHGLAREAQVSCLLEAYGIPFTFADAATTALCLDKGRTKMVLEHFGIATAPFAIISRDPQASLGARTTERVQLAIENSHHGKELRKYPLFAKPIGEGTSKGILVSSKIRSADDLTSTIDQLEAVYGGQDVLLESFLSGREITVGIIGTGDDSKVIGANEYVYKDRRTFGDRVLSDYIDFASDDVKNAPMDGKGHMDVVSADLSDPQVLSACQLALRTWKALRCRDAGRIDTRFDKMGENGKPHILEVNRIPGIVPQWSDLSIVATSNGIPYDEFLKQIKGSALKRAEQTYPQDTKSAKAAMSGMTGKDR